MFILIGYNKFFVGFIMMKKLLIVGAVLLSGLVHQVAADPAEKTAVNAAQLLAGVRDGLTGLQAEFIQYELAESGAKLDINSGLVWMQAPDMFRWHYSQPFEQLIVADGKQVWVYDEDLEQVTVKQQDNQMNPIYVIINDEMSQQHYQIKYETTEQKIDWISLTPKVHNEEVKAVWLAIKNQTVEQIKVFNNFGQTMIFEFKAIQKNPQFETGLFEFEPPEGVDVVQAIAGEIE